MNATVKQEKSCGPNQDLIDNTFFSGSDHTRDDVDGGQMFLSEHKPQTEWDEEQARNAARKRSSRICKMEEKKKEDEEKRAEEEAEAERKAEEKRVARQKRKQEKELQQGTDDKQRHVHGVYQAAHRDGVQYMVPAGMVPGVPPGHMIPIGPHGAAMPPQMMPTIMMQPQPHPHHVAAVPSGGHDPSRPVVAGWAAQPGAAAAVPVAAPVAAPQVAGAAPEASCAQRPKADTNRVHSGWTPIGTKKLSAQCLKQRIPRKKAQRARIRALSALASTWGVPDSAPAAAAAAPAAPAAAGASQPVLPNSEAAKARAAAVHEDLMRRRADTQRQLRKYVHSGKISSEMAQQRMAEVDQLSSVVVQICPSHPTATLQQLVGIAQSIITARQRQASLQHHPMFARLTGDQQRQLLELPHQQGTQVLANLTAQNSNSYQGGPQSHMSQQTHMTHYQAHPGPPQMQMRPPFSQPQMMASVAGGAMRPVQMQSPHRATQAQQGQQSQQMQAQQMQSQHMQAQQMQAQQMQVHQMQAQHMQAQQMQAQQMHVQHAQQRGQPAMRGGAQPVQAAPRYTVHNVSPLDDPLMTTMH